jgi:thiamine-monophosphate kinase
VTRHGTVGEAGERALLRRLRERIPSGPRVAIGVGDDAAAVETRATTLVTTDTLVEGVHFRRDWSPPRLVGRKAMAVNLSDVGAMGGTSRFATVSLALPADVPLAFVDGLYDGLLERAAEAGVAIVGGNVAATPGPIVIDVTLLGDAGPAALTRSGARADDHVVVTGALGAAGAGLLLLEAGVRPGQEAAAAAPERPSPEDIPSDLIAAALAAHLDPAPPFAFGAAVAESGLARAAMDLSDGLSGDLAAMCEASGVGAFVDAEALPVDPAASAADRDAALELALHGGEDYQLLLAVPDEALDPLRELAERSGVRVTSIGRFVSGSGVTLRRAGEATALRARSHEHFRSPGPAR